MEDLARTEGGWGRKEEEGVRAYLAPASRSCRPSEMRRRRGPPQQQAPVLVWSTERRGWIPVRAASIALLGADPAPSSPELVHPIHPSIHHPWVGGWKARVSMGGWTSSADEGGRPAAGERRSAVGMGRRGRRRGEQAAAGLERRSLRASFGLVGWGLGFQFFILVYFLI